MIKNRSEVVVLTKFIRKRMSRFATLKRKLHPPALEIKSLQAFMWENIFRIATAEYL